jgi:hypothetical protein
MYCKHCGGEVSGDSKFCSHCGKSSDILPSGADSTSFGEDKKTKKPFQRWSWGAFGLGWIYFCGMRYKYWGWLLVLGIFVNGISKIDEAGVAIIGLIVWLIMLIIFGIKGRSMAWESRKWKDEKEFIDTQRKWDIWGIIIFVVFQSILYIVPME